MNALTKRTMRDLRTLRNATDILSCPRLADNAADHAAIRVGAKRWLRNHGFDAIAMVSRDETREDIEGLRYTPRDALEAPRLIAGKRVKVPSGSGGVFYVRVIAHNPTESCPFIVEVDMPTIDWHKTRFRARFQDMAPIG